MTSRHGRDGESGFALVAVALLLLVLTTTAAIALHTTRTDLNLAGRLRESKYAFYAAEAGLAAGKQFLANNFIQGTGWTANLSDPALVCTFPETTKMNCCPTGSLKCIQSDPFFQPFASSNDPALKAIRTGYFVWFRNNCDLPNCADPSGTKLSDLDNRVIIHAEGYGPNGSKAVLELQVSQFGNATVVDCGYAQSAGCDKLSHTSKDSAAAPITTSRVVN